jgi:hypothetical protein
VYTVAINDRRWAILLAGGVALQVAAIGALHSSPAQIATVQACVIACVLIVNESVFHPILRTKRRYAGIPPRESGEPAAW